tara:strand:- start:3413 stop:3637 length:225 start_codon:yes stop_codon:yes gene_type:complete
MVEITEKEFQQFELLKKIFLHATAEKRFGVYFICGESGTKDANGLPENIMVCPAYGADINTTVLYKKHGDSSYE